MAPRRLRAMRPRRPRVGISVIEVVFAIVILAGVTLALARFGQTFSNSSARARWFVLASDLAAARLEVVRGAPDVASALELQGVETSTTAVARPSMAHAPGFTRTTTVTQVGTVDQRQLRVTVTVTGAPLTSPIKKSTTIVIP